MAEEHVLFLYMGENGNNKNNNFLPPIDTSLLINKITDSSTRLNLINSEKNKSKSGENNTHNSKVSQTLCIFSVLFFIIGGLLLIHFLQFIFSEQRSFCLYIFPCLTLIGIFCILGCIFKIQNLIREMMKSLKKIKLLIFC